jgi:hypothetical protein
MTKKLVVKPTLLSVSLFTAALLSPALASAQSVSIALEIAYGEFAGGNPSADPTGWTLYSQMTTSYPSVEARTINTHFSVSQSGSGRISSGGFHDLYNELNDTWRLIYDFQDVNPANHSIFTFNGAATLAFDGALPAASERPVFASSGVQPADINVPLDATINWLGDSSGYDKVAIQLYPVSGGIVEGSSYDLSMVSDPGSYTFFGLDPSTEYYVDVRYIRTVSLLLADTPVYVSGPQSSLPGPFTLLPTTESYSTRMTFTTIPEPASASLLFGFGVLGCGLLRRRRARGL